MRPVAIVVTRAVVTVKVAVNLARCVFAAKHAAIERILRTVAGAQTLWIVLIDETIGIVVLAVTAGVELAFAARHDTSGV